MLLGWSCNVNEPNQSTNDFTHRFWLQPRKLGTHVCGLFLFHLMFLAGTHLRRKWFWRWLFMSKASKKLSMSIIPDVCLPRSTQWDCSNFHFVPISVHLLQAWANSEPGLRLREENFRSESHKVWLARPPNSYVHTYGIHTYCTCTTRPTLASMAQMSD